MTTLVLDPGTCNWKIGPATETLPALSIPAVLGLPSKSKSLLKRKQADDEDGAGATTNKVLFGEDALHNAAKCNLSFPMNRGVVENWDHAEQLFHHCMQELEIDDLEESSILITVPPYNNRECTERLAAMCMENFLMSKIAVVQSGICSLYASGRTTGIVLESGEGVTSIIPVYDRFPLERSTNRLNWGGSDVTEYMRRLMYERGFSFSSQVDEWQVRLIKEQLGYVANDYSAELEKETEQVSAEFELPDGQSVEVGKERFRAPEILFQPTIVNQEHPSIGDFVAGTIKTCDINIRKDLSANIVLSGGNTLFEGFAHRLKQDVIKHFPGMFGSVEVIEPADRTSLVWAGGAVFCGLDAFDPLWVTREVYEDHGPTIVHNYDSRTSLQNGEEYE
jgi:actin, other eukaryote